MAQVRYANNNHHATKLVMQLLVITILHLVPSGRLSIDTSLQVSDGTKHKASLLPWVQLTVGTLAPSR